MLDCLRVRVHRFSLFASPMDWCIFRNLHWSGAVFYYLRLPWTGVYFQICTNLQLFFIICNSHGLVYISKSALIRGCFSFSATPMDWCIYSNLRWSAAVFHYLTNEQEESFGVRPVKHRFVLVPFLKFLKNTIGWGSAFTCLYAALSFLLNWSFSFRPFQENQS